MLFFYMKFLLLYYLKVITVNFFTLIFNMKPFAREYISHCLNSINQIINDPLKQAKAIHSYTQGQLESKRYQLSDKISDVKSWSSQDILRFIAAVFEANAEASHIFLTSPERALQVHEANALLLEEYIPLMTRETAPRNRLKSVQQNIECLKSELEEQSSFKYDTPFTLFSALTAAAVTVAAVAALFTQPELDNSNNRGPG